MENEIKEFFRQTAPKPADPTSFTLELNARLAAVEQIKAYRDREIRRTRRVFLIVPRSCIFFSSAWFRAWIIHIPSSAKAAAGRSARAARRMRRFIS